MLTKFVTLLHTVGDRMFTLVRIVLESVMFATARRRRSGGLEARGSVPR